MRKHSLRKLLSLTVAKNRRATYIYGDTKAFHQTFNSLSQI